MTRRREFVVGITGINSSDNPGPGVGVARSLKLADDVDVRLVGLAYDAMETGIYLESLFHSTFIIPYVSAGGEALLERLRYIRSVSGLDFIIPTLDVELPVFSLLEATLTREGIGTFLPTAEQFRLRGKDRLVEVAPAIGLSLPRTVVVASFEAFFPALEELTFPVMVKGAHYGALRAYTPEEAIAHFHTLVAQWGYPILVQETVTGDEINLIGVGDGLGGDLGHVSMKKIWTTAMGKVWTAVTVHNDPMAQAARRFTETYRWRGAFELECIADGDDVTLIEINPRFPAWCYFAAAVGVNLPAAMIRAARDLPALPVADFAAGRLFVRTIEERVTDLSTFQKMVTRGEA
ncbi:MAG: ATP-grasp domain-containing protein [Alphaproteobacteria bacterium]